MAFVHGKSVDVLVNGYDLSAYFNDASITYNSETAETTAFGNESKTYIVGLDDGTVSLSGMFDANTTDGLDTVVTGTLSDNVITTSVFYATPAAGGRVSMADGLLTNYEISSPVADVTSASLDIQGNDGVRQGDALSALAAVSTTTTGSEVDRSAGASTTAGVCSAHLHIVANDRDAGTLDVKITSATSSGGVYADVTGGAFTQIAAGAGRASERIAISGAVNRYVKVVYTVTGGTTGSYTPIVTLTRH